MTIKDELELDEAVEAFKGKPQEERDTLLFKEVLKTQLLAQKTYEEGCSQRCNDKKPWVNPGLAGTAAATFVYSMFKGIEMYFTSGGKAHP